MKFKPANKIQDLQYFGEFGGVNPSISDSATYTFLTANKMLDAFEGKAEGCHLYSRHTSPSNQYLGEALAAMENTQTANVAGSGMGAITTTLLHFCVFWLFLLDLLCPLLQVTDCLRLHNK